MGKVKIKRKSTFIDMTAMSDVTVLLLTFFMLTSTFLQKEPVIVNTPSSVSEIKVPEANIVTVLVSPKGQVFLTLSGDKDSTYSGENMKAELLKNVIAEYNKLHKDNQVTLTNAQVATFAKNNAFGMPISQLSDFLNQPLSRQDELIDPDKNPNAGIPININTNLDRPNGFQMWMRALYSTESPNFVSGIKDGTGIAVKADKGTPYEVVQIVMDNLQTMKMNKFSLMTALKAEGE